MDRKERQWLTSVIMSAVMVISMLSAPAASAAEGEPFGGSIDTYINSDGQAVDVETTEDGFIYQKVDSDGEEVVKVYGYVGGGTSITVPEKIGNTDVVSFAIDPRWPAGDEDYDQIESISLPRTIRFAHSAYIEEFRGLKSVKIASGCETYKSDSQGVLYKLTGSGCHVAAYPRARESKSFVMPDDMDRFYDFFSGCGLETITISEAMPYVCADDFSNLTKLKNVKVSEDNDTYFSVNGVLFTYDPDSAYDDEEDEWYDDGEVIYDDEDDWEDEDEELIGLCYYPAGRISPEYTVPADVTHIEDGAFAYNHNLQKITLPASVEVIAEDALIYLYDYMDGEDLLADPVLKTLVFKSTDVSDIYTDFRGVKTLYSVLRDKLNLKYPRTGAGYDDFRAWLAEEDVDREENYWDEDPELLSEVFPLGANIIVSGRPHYGIAYAVFSRSEEGTYTRKEPDAAGIWYVKLIVDRTDKYDDLESEPLEFEITDPPEGSMQNGWAYDIEEDTEVEYGEDYDVAVPAMYGKTRVLYGTTPNSRPEYQDDPQQWTEEKPSEPGEYPYILIVDETESYAGLRYVSSEQGFKIRIIRAPFEVRVICDDVPEGSAPSPRAEFFRGTETDKIDLDQIGFIYGTYKTVEGEDSDDPEIGDEPDQEEFEEMDGVPSEPGDYAVRAVWNANYYNKYYEISGETTFSIRSAAEIVEDMLDDITTPKDATIYSKEEVSKAIEAYEALSDDEKALVDPDKVQAMYDARARIESLEAKAELDEKRSGYDQALAAYTAAKTAADNSRAAATESAKTPGAAAVTATQKAETDAGALKEAADALKEAADALKTAADAYVDKANDDPVMTRRDRTDAAKAAAHADAAAASADTAVADAGQAVIDAGTARQNAETLAEAAKEEYSKKKAAAKKLKVSGFKVKTLRKKKAAVTWKVNKKGTGYDLRYSRKKNMKKAKKITIKKAKIKKATLKKLKARKYYYVRIRTITKLVNPETGKTVTVYGKWTKAKRFKAKK